MGLGPMEIAIIVVIVLLLFGPSQIPKLAKGIGSSVKEFRNAKRQLNDALDGRTPPDDKAA